MPGFLSQWVLSRVVKSALGLENEAIETYRRILEGLSLGEDARGSFPDAISGILEEEEAHRRVLAGVAAGALTIGELDVLRDRFHDAPDSKGGPLKGSELGPWSDRLADALEQEEKSWIFYGNLRRLSKDPVVKTAFEILAGMEREHLGIIRRLLGRGSN